MKDVFASHHGRDGVVPGRLCRAHVVDSEGLDGNAEQDDREVDVVPLQHHCGTWVLFLSSHKTVTAHKYSMAICQH